MVPATVPTICLNMIVKNESKIISRLFDSVIGVVDCYCISDTGSTDGTPKLIREYFESRGVPGRVLTDTPFRDFGYNRTVALRAAQGMATYLLLLDADMTLEVDTSFDKASLTAAHYRLVQHSNLLSYYNTRLVRGDLEVVCVGATHEYYDVGTKEGSITMNTLRILDIGDGGCKANKFERDIRLLKATLETHPEDARSHFYLANTYHDLGRYDEAIELYIRRIALGGWHEEVWYSYYSIGMCHLHSGRFPDALCRWLEGYALNPKRAEGLYEAVKYYREHGQHVLAHHFYRLAKAIPYPKDDMLFLHKAVYTHQLDYELSVFGYYLPEFDKDQAFRREVRAVYTALFATPCSQVNINNVLDNYQFYCPKLVETARQSVNLCGEKMAVFKCFHSSTPSIIRGDPHGEEYVVNIRYVNYMITPNGSYVFPNNTKIVQTQNARIVMDSNFNIQSETEIPHTFDPGCYIQGLEDVKLFSGTDGTVRFVGTRQVCNEASGGHILGICSGVYEGNDAPKMSSICNLASPKKSGCEKNWAIYDCDGKTLSVIYKWHPLTVATFVTDITPGDPLRTHTTLRTITNSPEKAAFLSRLRGSSNGFRYGHEHWFVCHAVVYGSPRRYYHCLVALDAATLECTRHTGLFTFEGECIEFCLGLVVTADVFVMTYSCWDSSSKLMTVSRDDIPLVESSKTVKTIK